MVWKEEREWRKKYHTDINLLEKNYVIMGKKEKKKGM